MTTKSEAAVDASGMYGMQQLQVELDKAAFGDGDVLPVIIEAKGSGAAKLMLYQAPQIVSPTAATNANTLTAVNAGRRCMRRPMRVSGPLARALTSRPSSHARRSAAKTAALS